MALPSADPRQGGPITTRRARRMPVMTLRRHGNLIPPVADDVLVSASIGPAGEAIALWSTPAGRDALLARTIDAGGASFPSTAPDRPQAVRVTVHNRPHGGQAPSTVVTIAELHLAYPHVQPLPDGRVLVVGGRCRWRPDGPDRNAVIYDHQGTPVTDATLGDGIEHVLATPTGVIWVAYFDEGIGGNYGWNNPGPQPIGSPGIIRFGSDLQPAWHYPDQIAFGPVLDCYALNVAGQDAWACYYTDFPIVRIDRSGAVTGWRNQVRGAHALLAEGSTVALVGGYGTDRDLVTAGTLADEVFTPTTRARPRLPGGTKLPSATIVARGTELHVLTDTAWFRLALDDVAR